MPTLRDEAGRGTADALIEYPVDFRAIPYSIPAGLDVVLEFRVDIRKPASPSPISKPYTRSFSPISSWSATIWNISRTSTRCSARTAGSASRRACPSPAHTGSWPISIPPAARRNSRRAPFPPRDGKPRPRNRSALPPSIWRRSRARTERVPAPRSRCSPRREEDDAVLRTHARRRTRTFPGSLGASAGGESRSGGHIHTHPFLADGGPAMQFNLFLPRAATYRIWLQAQRRGVVNTVSFTVKVSEIA